MAREDDRALTRREVDDALVHFARLAAAFAERGVGFVTVADNELTNDPVDQRSLNALRIASRALLADRDRQAQKSADVLKRRLHRVLTEEYDKLQSVDRTDVDAVERVDDDVRARFERELGVELNDRQAKRIAMTPEDVDAARGASQAAVEALHDALKNRVTPKGRGRSIYDAIVRVKERRSMQGTLSRFVPLAAARQHVEEAFACVEGRLKDMKHIALDAIAHPTQNADVLFELLDQKLRAGARENLPKGRDGFVFFFAALLRGEPIGKDMRLPPELEAAWVPLRETYAAIGRELALVNAIDAFAAHLADEFVNDLLRSIDPSGA